MSVQSLAPSSNEGPSIVVNPESLDRRRQQMLSLGWHKHEIAKFEASGLVQDDALPVDFPGAGFWAAQNVIQVDGRVIRL